MATPILHSLVNEPRVLIGISNIIHAPCNTKVSFAIKRKFWKRWRMSVFRVAGRNLLYSILNLKLLDY